MAGNSLKAPLLSGSILGVPAISPLRGPGPAGGRTLRSGHTLHSSLHNSKWLQTRANDYDEFLVHVPCIRDFPRKINNL